jgi:hypothetical protein
MQKESRIEEGHLELAGRASGKLARQVSSSIARPQIQVVVAPSGTKAILTWASSLTAQCPRDTGFSICEAGSIVDLSGRSK